MEMINYFTYENLDIYRIKIANVGVDGKCIVSFKLYVWVLSIMADIPSQVAYGAAI